MCGVWRKFSYGQGYSQADGRFAFEKRAWQAWVGRDNVECHDASFSRLAGFWTRTLRLQSGSPSFRSRRLTVSSPPVIIVTVLSIRSSAAAEARRVQIPLRTSHRLADLVATPLTCTHDSLEEWRTSAAKSLMVAPLSCLVTSQACGLVLAYLHLVPCSLLLLYSTTNSQYNTDHGQGDAQPFAPP